MSRTIFLNDLILLKQKTGIGCYVDQLKQHFPSPFPLGKLATVTDSPIGKLLGKTGGGGVGGGGGSSKIKQWLGDAAFWTLSKAFSRASLYHEPDAILLPIDAPSIATFHDLSVIRFPQWHPDHRVRKYEQRLAKSLKRTGRFIAVSQSTANQLTQYLSVAPDLIRTIPEAARPQFRVLSSDVREAFRKRFQLPERFCLYVGTLEPRKNIERLIQVFSRFQSGTFPLVLVGGWGWRSEGIRQALEKNPGIRHLGYLSDVDVVAAVNAASLMIYPSYYEGFGLPIVEAMASGCPVACSTDDALLEVAGTAALTFDAEDEDAIYRTLKTAMDEPERLRSMVSLGLERAKSFSWERTARETLAVYAELLA